jgi:hypothetical protein
MTPYSPPRDDRYPVRLIRLAAMKSYVAESETTQ